MTSHIFASPELWNWPDFLPRRARKSASESSDVGGETTWARREFINDMLTRNPDAFSSDLDVLGMMHMYPGRF